MSTLDDPKALFNATCATNSEPFALQNLGNMMAPEFADSAIIIIDPGMALHHLAYAIIEYQDELYFRQYIERGAQKFMVCLNAAYPEIEITDGEFSPKGCVIQQKRRGQKPLHYYHLNPKTRQLDFHPSGKVKEK